MQPLRVIIVGPGDGPRRALAEGIRRLGHDVLGAPNAERGAGPSQAVDVVVVDLRAAGELAGRVVCPGDDGVPLVAIVDEAALPEGILERRSGIVLAVGGTSETGLEVALRVCAALSRRNALPDGRRAPWSTVPSAGGQGN